MIEQQYKSLFRVLLIEYPIEVLLTSNSKKYCVITFAINNGDFLVPFQTLILSDGIIINNNYTDYLSEFSDTKRYAGELNDILNCVLVENNIWY